MIITLTNDVISVGINTLGAALTSIKDQSGHDYLWHGDPSIWAGQAPNLFPFVGKINNERYRYAGQEYRMQKHGFARHSQFTVLEQTTTQVTMRLSDSAGTRANYPFQFHLDIEFALAGTCLSVSYRVTNRSQSVLPFSLGSHPALACNWAGDDSISDYYLDFEQSETSDYVQFNGVSLGRKRHPCLLNSKRLDLTNSLFDIDAIIFDDLQSQAITLRCRKPEVANKWVRVEFSGFPYLGIWSKPKAPYICIEPWFGVDDYEDADTDILHKEGMQLLAQDQEFGCQYCIVIGNELVP